MKNTTKKKVIKKAVKTITTRISRTKAVELIKKSGSRFITVTFNKVENGESRTINCKYINQTTLGTIQVDSIKDKGVRSFSPLNLTGLKINGINYKVR